MERDLRSVVRPVSKGRFRTLPVCKIKLRNFESKYSGDATETSAWVDFYSTYGPFPLYIIRCKLQQWVYLLCVYTHKGIVRCSVVYIIARRGQGFTLLILTWRQCEGLILGIGAERNITPTSFFVSRRLVSK